MKLSRAIPFSFLILIGISSCTKEVHNYIPVRGSCDSGLVSYKTDIQPIIQANCSGTTCHQAGTGNYDFTSYDVLASEIRLGQVQYRLLLPVDDPQHMPQTGPPFPVGYELRDSCDLYKILLWIKQGYPDN
jgi:hypothetical protein